MFRLVLVQESVRIKPADLCRPLAEAVLAELDGAYLDKVIADVGLVVATYDIQEISGGILHHSEGAPHYEVKFRLLVFRPIAGEIIKGKILRSDERGVHITLGFFADIVVTEELMPERTYYNQTTSLWCWQSEDAELILELGEDVFFKVNTVTFNKQPTRSELDAAGYSNSGGSEADKMPYMPPMEIYGSFQDSGLGIVGWWPDDQAETEEPVKLEDDL